MAHDRLNRAFLGSGEAVSVCFEEQRAQEEASPLVPIREWMIANDCGGVRRCQFNDAGIAALRVKLPRSRQGGFKQTMVAQTGRATVQCQQAAMDGERLALLDPGRFLHLASAWRVFV